jgi:hypothetical protein
MTTSILQLLAKFICEFVVESRRETLKTFAGTEKLEPIDKE